MGLQQAQQAFWIAVSKARTKQISDIASAHTTETLNRGYAEAGEIAYENSVRTTLDARVASIEDQAMGYLAQIRYNTETIDASYRGNADILSAGYQVDNIKAEAAAAVDATQKTTLAEIGDIGQEATIRVGTIQSTADAQKSVIDGEATIDAARYAALAKVAVTDITARIGVDSSTAIAVANIEAGTITQDASIRATASRSVAGFEVANISAEASINASSTAALASISVGLINADAAAQARSERESARIRSIATRQTADIRASAAGSRAAISAASLTDLARLQASYDVYAATTKSDAAKFDADNDYAAGTYAADQQYLLTKYRADSQYQSTVSTSDIALSTARYSATSDYNKTIDVAAVDATIKKADADASYSQLVTREDTATFLVSRNLQWLKSGWDMMIPSFNATKSGPSIPTWVSGPPSVSKRIPHVRSAVDRKINARFARTDAGLAARNISIAGDLGGRGWNPAGPGLENARLSAAIEAMAEKASARSGVWLESASRNAETLLAAQLAGAGSSQASNEAMLQAEKNFVQRQVGYLEQASALAT